MPRNGSGVYTLPGGINPVVTQTLITSNWANTTMTDLAQALTQSLAKDGQTLPTANLPMGGFRHTGAGNPQGLQDYMTLSFQQTGQATRLTSVSGSPNAITATLVGGATTFSVGQLVQLVPAVTNTGAVTLDINGGGPKPILSSQGQPLGATNLAAGQVYLLSWNGAAWNILTSPDITAFAQAAISGWFRPGPVAPYPDITQVNPNTIAIPAGSGRLIAPSARDITSVINVSWPAQNHVLTNIASQWETTIGINASGNVVEFIGNVNPAWARNNIILGTIGHINGAIQYISNKPAIFGDVAYMAYDLGILFHNTLVKGGRVTGNVGNPLHIDIAAGTLWVVGGNADQVDSPNFLPFPTNTNASFWPVSTTLVQAITQTVPVGFYDQAGAGPIIAIPGGGATSVIHRLYLLAGQLVFSYGQFTYGSLDDAVNAISRDDTIFTPPAKLVDATFVAWIVARKDATDLNNPAQARLIGASSGGSSSGGGGGGVPDAPFTGQTFGRNNGVWVLTVDAVQAGSNIVVDATNPNKPIINMPSGNLVAGPGVTFGGTGTNRLVGAVGNLTIGTVGDGDLVAGYGTSLGGTLADRLVGPGNVTINSLASPFPGLKNRFINGNFDIWQRGISGPGGYLADRWFDERGGPTPPVVTVSQQNFPDINLGVPQSTRFYHRVVIPAPGVNAADFFCTAQRIEFVNTCVGDHVISFWARADAPKFMSVSADQVFGTSGSPSAGVSGIGAVKLALTTAWQKFTVALPIPSLGGKTITTGDMLICRFWYDAGSSFDARTATLGHQSGTFDLANVQIEPGTVATNFEYRPIGLELELCQRYCYRADNGLGRIVIGTGGYFTTTQILGDVRFPTTMRAKPAVVLSAPGTWRVLIGAGAATVSVVVVQDESPRGFSVLMTTTVSPQNAAGQIQNADVALGTAFFQADAEL